MARCHAPDVPQVASLQSPALMSDLVVVTKGLGEIRNMSPRPPVCHTMTDYLMALTPSLGQSISSGGSSVDGDSAISRMSSVTTESGHSQSDGRAKEDGA